MSMLTAATSLLNLLCYLRDSTRPPHDLSYLREQILEEIKNFEEALSDQEDAHLVLAVRYCLIAAIDEAILATSWGANSAWIQHPLLSALHQENIGGEKFYIILETLAKDPEKNTEALKLLYVLLRLGFEGKFYNQDPLIREEIQKRLLQRLSPYLDKKIITSMAPTNAIAQTASRKWYVGAAICWFAVYFYLNYSLLEETSPLRASLEKMGRGSALLTYEGFMKK